MTKLSDEEIEKLLKTLPPELKTAVFSEETAESVRRICERNKLTTEDMPQVATLAGDVLIGFLPPEELPKKLQEELDIEESRAQRISQEASRLIFYPVQDSLNKLYGKTKPAAVEKETGQEMTEKVVATTERERVPRIEKAPTKEMTQGPDVYREPVDVE